MQTCSVGGALVILLGVRFLLWFHPFAFVSDAKAMSGWHQCHAYLTR